MEDMGRNGKMVQMMRPTYTQLQIIAEGHHYGTMMYTC